MADSAFTVHAASKAHVAEEISKITFPTANGRYTHDAAAQFVRGIHSALKSTCLTIEPGQGLAALLRSSNDATNASAIAAIKSTDAKNAGIILRESAKEARAAQLASGNPDVVIPAAITTRADAMDAAA